ncbi:39S ribosomal protein L12, mitochondrial-like [Daphnia pulicaria]|uniref:39S ribosomal protein L12, mitochondrial-like n=1 Tax=Daphnia pulicaria TaxID=35523 RepID=UPI001EEC17B7|nr:39S ribosomal protein L12, mitochondrial-like [Daphnia pulicaria]
MISTKIFLLRSVVRQKVVISSSIRFRTITQAASAEKIQRIVNDISQLTLIEVAELNQVLKTTLKIPDAPVMAYGAGLAAGPVQPKEEEEEAPKAKVQTIFTVKLTKFDETKKIALIKEIKNIVEGMNLVQAKKFVETLPAVVRADIPKDEAEKLSSVIAAAGGICEIV